jgi:hypothetical protein
MHFPLADDLGYGNLIFMGCFFLALIAVAIWWLRR